MMYSVVPCMVRSVGLPTSSKIRRSGLSAMRLRAQSRQARSRKRDAPRKTRGRTEHRSLSLPSCGELIVASLDDGPSPHRAAQSDGGLLGAGLDVEPAHANPHDGSREEPVVRAPVLPQPGSMPAFLIAPAASGEVRNFRSAAAPAGFLAWLCTPPEKTVISCMSSGRGPR